MNSNMILFKTLLLSTSSVNILRHTKDKKKKKKIIAGFIGMFFLYAILACYSLAMVIGYGLSGLNDSTPVICALSISILSLVFTFFRTNGYLFNFKEYDMLMSLPFEESAIAGCKFLYMYVKTLPWYLCISLAMLAGYGFFARPHIIVYPVWIILSFFLPVIPMLISSFLGFLIARISAGFKKTNVVQTVLSMIFVILCFSSRFIIEDMLRNNKVEATLEMVSQKTDSAARIYLPAGWFTDAITKHSISSFLLLVGVSILLFALLFYFVGRSYRNINSALKSHAAGKKYRMTAQKKRSVTAAIAYKEFKRMTGSTTYMTNAGIGVILAALFAIVTLIIGFDKIIAVVTQNAPLDAKMLQPAIPFLAYFFIGMISTTACSPSLEGKNYWIVQSLPIDKKTLYHGKMLFNMCFMVPFMVFSVICLCISARTPFFNTILYIILGMVLCAFSTAWGLVCGLKHMRLDWENEIEVIKQSSAVVIYMLPNMFANMALVVLVVYLGTKKDHVILTLIMILVISVLAFLSYLRAMSLAEKTE
ncbi:MAG: hypothetical protein K6G22_09495 [Lachnospiraceae bacterium]|nr:hypothetical protein [Lachnospiraceae bacterium]